MRAGLPGHPRSPRPLRRLRLRARNCRAGCAHWWRGRSAPREHQFHRHAVGHLARQPGHRAAEGDHGPRRLRQPEGGGVGGDADVGAEQQLHAGREAVAVDGGNHRLVEGEVAQARRFLQRPVVQDAALPFIAGLAVPPQQGQHGSQVTTRTEGLRPAAGHDEHPHLIVARAGDERVRRHARHSRIDGVAHLRAIEDDRRDAVGLRKEDRRRHVAWAPVTPVSMSHAKE